MNTSQSTIIFQSTIDKSELSVWYQYQLQVFAKKQKRLNTGRMDVTCWAKPGFPAVTLLPMPKLGSSKS
jgi:hypothetical protein